MNKNFEKWSDAVKSAFPSALSPHWRTMPIGRMTKLMVGLAVLTLGAGCLADLLQIRTHPLAYGLYWPALFVVMGPAIFIARVKRPALFVPLSLLIFLGLLLGYLGVRASPTVPITEADFRRILVVSENQICLRLLGLPLAPKRRVTQTSHRQESPLNVALTSFRLIPRDAVF